MIKKLPIGHKTWFESQYGALVDCTWLVHVLHGPDARRYTNGSFTARLRIGTAQSDQTSNDTLANPKIFPFAFFRMFSIASTCLHHMAIVTIIQ